MYKATRFLIYKNCDFIKDEFFFVTERDILEKVK